MTTPVTTQVTPLAAENKQQGDPKFDKALADAQAQIPVDQLAQMGVAVFSPLFLSQMQDIIGDAMGGDD
jgi:hypothetical protein